MDKEKRRLTLDDLGSFLEKLAENSNHVYWLSSADLKRIQYISPAYEKLWGRPRTMLYDNPEVWITYIYPEDATQSHPIHEMAEHIRERGEAARFEESYRIVRPDGEIRWILDRGFPIYDEEGTCCGVTGVAVDITKEKQIEENLSRAKEAAESASRAKDAFIMNMAHDIRTPLTGMVCMAEDLTGMVAQDKEALLRAQLLSQASKRLHTLLEEVLELSKAEQIGEGDVKKESVDLCDLICQLNDLLLPSIKEKGLELKLEVDPNLPKLVQTDRLKLERILLNLMGNAIKFTERGQIILSAQTLSKQKDTAKIEFRVSDTGIGIPSDKLEKVFDRFVRLDPSYRGVYKGHGVGLFIVKQYIKVLDGTIQVKSIVGQGTTFQIQFTLPIIEMDQVHL